MYALAFSFCPSSLVLPPRARSLLRPWNRHHLEAQPTVAREVRLAAAPALGAIPLAFIRNQFQYCSLICPHAVEGAITVPIAGAGAPATFLGSLASTGSPFRRSALPPHR